MSAEWFWNMAGTEVGPLTAEQLKALVATGKLAANDLVKRGRDGAWLKAASWPLLFPPLEPGPTQ